MPQETIPRRRRRRAGPPAGDARRHPLENAFTVTGFVLGMCALVFGFIPATHFLGALAALLGLPTALYAQLISATTGERFANVIAMIAAFVGGAMALRHGGFSL
ncbi:hypothetical protein [Thermomonospora catenispora]|mgnify:CR=1 FL=1|uniref:hypothetical protein n=1 Tax=Thermomonospora catenispora TaxID=2493090 RepID=UPI001122D7A4|nr:hypothetical protein [Thermomonospora catenispora]TNY37702.1 hypothetical protein EIO00_05895 [Thermomonospora catenispora]